MERGNWDQIKWLIYGIILSIFLGIMFMLFWGEIAICGPLGVILGLMFRLRKFLKNRYNKEIWNQVKWLIDGIIFFIILSIIYMLFSIIAFGAIKGMNGFLGVILVSMFYLWKMLKNKVDYDEKKKKI